MKKQLLWFIAMLLLASLFLCACGGETNVDKTSPNEIKPADNAEQAVETTEQDISPDPEWFSEDVIDEAVACLFPMEGEINVDLAQELLLPLLEIGNPEAQYYWGYIYDCMIPDNCGEEEQEALYWYELSAAQGFPKAYLAMAMNTYIGSEERAAELIASAEQAGLFDMSPEELGPDGCEYIGDYYAQEGDYTKAANWFLEASKMGGSIGMNNLGYLYFLGLGVTQDYITAADFLSKAANMGNVLAMCNYGVLLSHDDVAIAVIEDEYVSALSENLEAANAGNAEAMYNIGNMYYFGYRNHIFTDPWYETLSQNEEAAIEWYQKAAETGHTDAMYMMGYAYLYGDCCDANPEKANFWLEKAADEDHPFALIRLSSMYSSGKGVEQNQAKAMTLYNKGVKLWWNTDREAYYSECGRVLKTAMDWEQKAAEAGLADSMSQLGYLYTRESELTKGRYGETTISDESEENEAMKWCQKGADTGSSAAMFNLACEYRELGKTTERAYMSDPRLDPLECLETSREYYDTAMKWFIMAYVNGYENAEAEIEKMLTYKQGVNGYFENYEELVFANTYATP